MLRTSLSFLRRLAVRKAHFSEEMFKSTIGLVLRNHIQYRSWSIRRNLLCMFAPGTAIISAGAKFSTSPSVYVGFQSLYATDFCGTVGGNVYSATTLAFKEGDLCTAPAYFWNSAEYNVSQPFLFHVYTRATWEA